MNKCLFAILCTSYLSSVVGKRISTKNSIERHRQGTAAARDGEVEMALRIAQAQLEDELAAQHKKNQHEKEQKAKYNKDINEARDIVNAWACEYFGWFVDWVYKDYCSHLEHHQLPYLVSQVASSTKELTHISATIVRLDTQVRQTLTAVSVAKTEEGLVENLNDEIQTLGQRKKDAKGANDKMEDAEKKKGDRKISAFDEELAKLLAALKIVEAEHALLTEEHTGGHCADKEQKGETICKRCSEGKACGDECISADKHCWYDAGCACMISAADPPSFLQVGASAHPLREKLNKAKAAVKEVIHAEQEKIDNLKAQLATSQADIEAAEEAKRVAEKKFTEEIETEKQTHVRLTKDQDAAIAEEARLTALLAKQKGEGAEEVAKLVGELEEDIANLKKSIVETEHEKTSTMEANAAAMLVLKDKHASEINDIVVEIQKLEGEKKVAQAKLDAISKTHGLSA